MRNYLLILFLLPFILKLQTLSQIYVHTDCGAYFPSDTVNGIATFGWRQIRKNKFNFKTIKMECIYHHKFIDRESAKLEVFSYIKGFYHTKLIHSAIGYKLQMKWNRFIAQNRN